MTIKNHCSNLRAALRSLGSDIKNTKETAVNTLVVPGDPVDKGEVLANLTLAFRHIEDAIMRLGKTIQALDGGVSCYDETAKRCTDGPMAALRAEVERTRASLSPSEQAIVDSGIAVEQKVAACKEQASERSGGNIGLAPFHAVPAKDCCRAPVGERHDPACCNSKSYSP